MAYSTDKYPNGSDCDELARVAAWELTRLLEELRSLSHDALEAMQDGQVASACRLIEQAYEPATDFERRFDVALEMIRRAADRDPITGDPIMVDPDDEESPTGIAAAMRESRRPQPPAPRPVQASYTYPEPGGEGLRALTLWQPWAWAMANGIKTIENRSWSPPAFLAGQRFALHASKKWDAGGDKRMRELLHKEEILRIPHRRDIVHGAVVAVARFIREVDADDVENLGDDHGRWYFGPSGWLLGDVIRLHTPVPCRGYQGLWRLPRDLERLVLDQIPPEAW